MATTLLSDELDLGPASNSNSHQKESHSKKLPKKKVQKKVQKKKARKVQKKVQHSKLLSFVPIKSKGHHTKQKMKMKKKATAAPAKKEHKAAHKAAPATTDLLHS